MLIQDYLNKRKEQSSVGWGAMPSVGEQKHSSPRSQNWVNLKQEHQCLVFQVLMGCWISWRWEVTKHAYVLLLGHVSFRNCFPIISFKATLRGFFQVCAVSWKNLMMDFWQCTFNSALVPLYYLRSCWKPGASGSWIQLWKLPTSWRKAYY